MRKITVTAILSKSSLVFSASLKVVQVIQQILLLKNCKNNSSAFINPDDSFEEEQSFRNGENLKNPSTRNRNEW